jgi:hypothetical protein
VEERDCLPPWAEGRGPCARGPAMESQRLIKVDRQGDVFFVRMRHTRLEEIEIHQLGEEIASLCTQQGCRKMALSLGPEAPDCLYSVFLAKLVSIRNSLARVGGKLVLSEVGPVAMSIFEACLLHREFVFVPDFAAAAALFNEPAAR